MVDLQLDAICEYCVDGQQAIDRAQQILAEADDENLRPISMMILDFQMPKKNGIEVVKEITKLYQERSGLKSPELAFITAFGNAAFKTHLLQLGVMHYFTKPIKYEQLEEITRHVSFA